MKTRLFTMMLLASFIISGHLKGQSYNYAEALQKSLYFYDAEKSGPGITGGLLPWRGNSELSDMQLPLNTTMTDMSQAFIDANKAVLDPSNKGYVDVSGGFHDAGDHVKFGLPQSYSSSTLEWALYEFKDAFVKTGELNHMRGLMKWFSDYYLRSTFMNSSGKVVAFCYQVGEGNSDHTLWAPPEIIDRTVIKRPGYFATSEKPASDQCAGAAASLALSYLNNKTDSLAYANKCLTYAKALYDFAILYRGMGYSGGFYNSSFDEDELSWAAIWLNIATNDPKYLNDIIKKDANGMYTGWMAKIIHSATDNWQNIWVHSWDTKWGGVFAKLAPITNDPFYWYIFRWNLEYWSGVPHVNAGDGTFLAKTPAGFSFLNSWGSARYNAAAQFQAMVYKKYAASTIFDNWTISQMQYIMGKNPLNRSYIVGYSTNYAKHPHHRAAHGSSTNSMFDPIEHKHILYGALVGGPGANDEHVDETKDFVYNEVAIDYNAGLVGALAGLYNYFGQGQLPIANFIPTDPPLIEYGIEAKIEQENTERSQISVRVNNVPAYPPRLDVTPMARYFFNISEMAQYNQTIADISTAIYYDESSVSGNPVKVSGPLAWDVANGVYYMEFQWPKGIYGKRELQFALMAHQDPILYKAHWDPTNDYSHQGLTTTYTASPYITLYVGGKLLLGTEPAKGVPVAVTGVTLAPSSISINVGLVSQLAATILPANATNKSVTWTSGNTAVATVGSTGLVTAISKGTATITVTTADGAKSATCIVTVTDSGAGTCSFGTPLLIALPTISNKTYTYVYVLGTGGPLLSNISNFTINWDLTNKGLYQLSVNTKNGIPNWFVDLKATATQTFASPLPAITLSGTGFTGLDGSYYVGIDNGNFVMASKTGTFTIYFSNSATAPACTKSAMEQFSVASIAGKEILLYPNPSYDGNMTIKISITKPSDVAITLFNQMGQPVLKKSLGNYDAGIHDIRIQTKISGGVYFIEVKAGDMINYLKIESL